MSSAIQNIMQRALGDGARAAKFECLFQFTNPSTAPDADDMMALVKTASFPGKQHTTIDLKYKGRSIPIKGQTKYTQTWECTFYLTEDHKLKHAFENWIEALDQKHNYAESNESANLLETQRIHTRDYTTSIRIFQNNFDGSDTTAKYTLFNVFPTEVSAVQTSYESVGQIQEFTVTFSYSHFSSEILKGKSGNFVDTIVGKIKDASSGFINGVLNDIGDAINGFVNDAIGNSINELNDWANGLTSDFVPSRSSQTISQLVSGGLGPEYMKNTVVDKAEDLFNSAIGGFATAFKSNINKIGEN